MSDQPAATAPKPQPQPQSATAHAAPAPAQPQPQGQAPADPSLRARVDAAARAQQAVAQKAAAQPPAPPAAPRGPSASAPPAKGKSWTARRHLIVGGITVLALVIGLGGWGATVNIAGAIVAPGMIEVESNRQIVQHPEGGVIGEILAKDGDRVEAGQIVIRLDGTFQRSELAIVEGQLFEILARRGRLEAERDGLSSIAFPAELSEYASTTQIRIGELMQGQTRLFASRQNSLRRETEQLRERQIQIEQQIEGSEAQLGALNKQLSLVLEELGNKQSLLERNLAQASEVLALQREEARILGETGAITAQIAESRGRIAEIEIQIVQAESTIREEAIATLRDLQYNEIELKEQRLSTLETLSRQDIRAPVSGIVYGQTVFAQRAVIRPADPLMYIVPEDSPLVITSQIEPIHIDQVHIGQDAKLVFSAFDMRTTPELEGFVTNVSADAIIDPNTGRSYYEAKVLPKEGEMEKLGELEVLPGMPVESFIRTDDRTPLQYLTKPIMTYFNRAFRES